MRKWIRWGPAIAWMAVIFYLSSQTGGELNSLFPILHQMFPGMNSFNWGHFVAYFILYLTFYWAIGNNGWRRKAYCILLCVLYGLTDEFHQQFVDERTPDILDLRNDTIGATLSMVFVSIPSVRRILHKLQHSIKF